MSDIYSSLFSSSHVWGNVFKVHELYQTKLAEAETEAKGLMGEEGQLTRVHEFYQRKLAEAKVEAEKEIEREERGMLLVYEFYEEKLAEAEIEAKRLIGEEGQLVKVYGLYQRKLAEAKIEAEKAVGREATILLMYEFSIIREDLLGSPNEEAVEAREKIGKGEEGISSIYKFYKNKINEAAIEAELMRLERGENILKQSVQETAEEANELMRKLMEDADPNAARFPIIKTIPGFVRGEYTDKVRLAMIEFYEQKIADGEAEVEKRVEVVVEEKGQLIEVYKLYREKLASGTVMGEMMSRNGMEQASKNANDLYQEKLVEAETEAKGLIGEEGQLPKVHEFYQRQLAEAKVEAEKAIERAEKDIPLVYKLYEEKLAEAEAEAKRSIGEGGQLTKVYELYQKKLVEVSRTIKINELLKRILINQLYMKILAGAEAEARVKIGEGDWLTEVYKLYQEKISEAEEKVKTKLNKIGERVLKADEPSCKGVF